MSESLTRQAERNGWSRRKLQQMQDRKGLPRAQEFDEASSCRQLAGRWLERGVPPEKVAGRLQRRGFSYSLIRQTLEALEAPGDPTKNSD